MTDRLHYDDVPERFQVWGGGRAGVGRRACGCGAAGVRVWGGGRAGVGRWACGCGAVGVRVWSWSRACGVLSSKSH
eukprot:7222883-Pyramimonas_sp.AAC.1